MGAILNYMRSLPPIAAFIEAREWRRRDREETAVATAEYQTTIVDSERKPTGDSVVHIVVFFVNGNASRYSRVTSTQSLCEKRHQALLRDKTAWRHHGDLPEHARRVDGPPRGGAKLIMFPGGGAA